MDEWRSPASRMTRELFFMVTGGGAGLLLNTKKKTVLTEYDHETKKGINAELHISF